MSKHWNPSWHREPIVLKEDPEKAVRRGAAARARGEVPPAYLEPDPCPKAGISRMGVLGPDYASIVHAFRREEAGPLQEQLGRFTWYFICTRPRIRAVAGECGVVGGFARLVFEVSCDDGTLKRWSITERKKDLGVHGLSVADDGNTLVVHSASGVDEQDAALVAQQMRANRGWTPSELDLEVRYIGRARGTKQETSALDRLESHDKYQSVLEELHQSPHRNRDPWIVLHGGTTMSTMMATGPEIAEPTKAELEAADAETRRALSTSVRVDLVEAMLINYFKPALNQHHTKVIDDRGALLRKCRKAGLTGVTLVVYSETLGVAFYTESQPPSLHGALTICL